MAKKVAMVLSGCGVFDGAELHEAVISNLALHRAGFEVEFFAPDIEQAHVFNHLTGENSPGETRNVLTEAARIARGKITDLAKINVADYVGVVFPGGFGAAKNLSTYAFDFENCKVNEDVANTIRKTHDAGKPLLFMCIAPMVAARVLERGVELTIGSSPKECQNIDKMGARHVVKKVDEVHVDKEHKVVSTPAFMYEAPITEIAEGIEKAVAEFTKLVG